MYMCATMWTTKYLNRNLWIIFQLCSIQIARKTKKCEESEYNEY